jgi:glycosyltransferase involved in cell wall biosynthesis
MRIGINGLAIAWDYKGGVNSFTFGLLDAFARVGSSHDFTIFACDENMDLFDKYSDEPSFRLVELNQTNHRYARYCFHRLPWQLRYRLPGGILNRIVNAPDAAIIAKEVDVHFVPFCPPFLFPFSSKPTIYSLHDIQHEHFPQFFSSEELRGRRRSFRQCVAHAAMVQASSRYMRRVFLEHFPVLDETKVVVIREGVDIESFRRPRPTGEVLKKYGLPDSFLLYPAQLWHHKNHVTILRALKRLRAREITIPLVLTGARYTASQGIFDFIRDAALDPQVFHLGLIPFNDLVALYQGSRFVIMASLHESSSLPILEAAAAGTAIIASRTPPIEEMAEHLEMQLFAPTDDHELAELLAAAWNNDSLRRRRIEVNNGKISQFSWDNSARQYIQVFESMAETARVRQA